ncbi:hypothetical protein ABK040_009716 [Willaertia magna]
MSTPPLFESPSSSKAFLYNHTNVNLKTPSYNNNVNANTTTISSVSPLTINTKRSSNNKKEDKDVIIQKEQLKLLELTKLRMAKIKELEQLEKEKQEREKIKKEIQQLEKGTLQYHSLKPKIWKMDDNKLINFNLTDARKDLIIRMKSDKLYTLEECKILIKEIVRIMKRDAEKDFKNLIFLSKVRTELLFPKPIVNNYLSQTHGLDGFPDDPEINQLIYNGLSVGSNNDCIVSGNDVSGGANDVSNVEDSLLNAKDKLRLIVLNLNKNLVKLIDNALRQRKERLLVIATILEELEKECQRHCKDLKVIFTQKNRKVVTTTSASSLNKQ